VIRLGLLGMRLAEISALNIDNLRQLPAINWTGKGHKPRRVTAGASLREVLASYLDAYGEPSPSSPIICREVLGAARQGGPRRLDWGMRAQPRTVFTIVTNRAKAAGLGHVAPHDLRRSAAGILHNAVGPDGGHRFDLLDIQRVLGHSDPATTMRSYLEPMKTDVIDRAAKFLD
jgi:integrase/recombinase XerC